MRRLEAPFHNLIVGLVLVHVSARCLAVCSQLFLVEQKIIMGRRFECFAMTSYSLDCQKRTAHRSVVDLLCVKHPVKSKIISPRWIPIDEFFQLNRSEIVIKHLPVGW